LLFGGERGDRVAQIAVLLFAQTFERRAHSRRRAFPVSARR
jgi:hypothetical protein